MKRITTMFSTLFGIGILLLVVVVVPMKLESIVDAAKVKGVSNSQYGMETKNKVCGDRLCSEIT